MPDTPTLTLVHSEIRDLLQGATQNANALQTECDFVLAASLPSSRRTSPSSSSGADCRRRTALATSSSRIALSTLTTYRPPFAAPAPTRCAARATNELGQLELRSFSDLLEFVADDTRKPTTDDFAQTVTVHKSVSEKLAAIVAGIVVAPRVIKRVDTIFAETILKTFFADDALRTIYREKAARIQGAGGTSIALLAAIRSSVANVRPCGRSSRG